MENAAWLGYLAAAFIAVYALKDVGDIRILINVHGAIEVLGGVCCAALVNYPFSQIRRAGVSLFRVFIPKNLPNTDEVATELVRLAGISKAQGGLLALQNEGRDFADGFLNRALLVAIAAGEQQKVREILEADIRQLKTAYAEDANFFRTVGTLAPMFGLLGTLLGIILVLRTMSDPTKVGPSMSLAITASLYGISFANLLCIPVAGNIRMKSLAAIKVQEVIMEGVLDLMRGESQYLLELRLGSYSEQRRLAMAGTTEAATT